MGQPISRSSLCVTPYPLVVHSCRAFEPWLPNYQSVGIGCVVLNANSWRHGYLRGKGHIFLYRRFGLCSCFFLIDSFLLLSIFGTSHLSIVLLFVVSMGAALPRHLSR